MSPTRGESLRGENTEEATEAGRSRSCPIRSVGQNPIQPAEATDLKVIFVHLWRFSGPPAILWGGCIEPRVRELVLTHAPRRSICIRIALVVVDHRTLQGDTVVYSCDAQGR